MTTDNNVENIIKEKKTEFKSLLSTFLTQWLKELKSFLNIETLNLDDDLQKQIKLCSEISNVFIEKYVYFDKFIGNLENVYIKLYNIGINESTKETRLIYERTSWVQDLDLLRINSLYEKHKKTFKFFTEKFLDFVHDYQMEMIITGQSIINVYYIFNDEEILKKYKEYKNEVSQFINFTFKEILNIAKIFFYRQANVGYYKIIPNKKRDKCPEKYFEYSLPLYTDAVFFPPFEPDCNCSLIIDKETKEVDNLYNRYKQKKSTRETF